MPSICCWTGPPLLAGKPAGESAFAATDGSLRTSVARVEKVLSLLDTSRANEPPGHLLDRTLRFVRRYRAAMSQFTESDAGSFNSQHRWRSDSFRCLRKRFKQAAISSSVCSLDNVIRRRLLPLATVGGRIGMTSKPVSSNCSEAAIVLSSCADDDRYDRGIAGRDAQRHFAQFLSHKLAFFRNRAWRPGSSINT